MKNLIGRRLAGLAITVLTITTIVAMATPAQAVIETYTPHGEFVSAVSTDFSITDDEAAQTFTCEQFDMSGSIPTTGVSRPFGTIAATWDQLDYSGCVNPIFGDTTLDTTGAWGFAITGPEVHSTSPAALTDVSFLLTAAGCSFNIVGDVSGTFDDSTGVFSPSASTLTIADGPAGFICPLLGFMKDDHISITGTWRISGLTISNP